MKPSQKPQLAPRSTTRASRLPLRRASHHQGRTLPILPPERPPSVFRFKHFDIAQGSVAMKMGTDAMILGSWVRPGPAAKRILDVGCGTGVLALMAAQRAQEGAVVHAIDVDEDACAQATQNAAASPFSDMVHVFKLSFQELVQQASVAPSRSEEGGTSATSNSSGGSSKQFMGKGSCDDISAPTNSSGGGHSCSSSDSSRSVCGMGSYDLIISNPPYFQDSFKSLEHAREARRVRRSRHTAKAASPPRLNAEAHSDGMSAPEPPAATITLAPPSPQAQAEAPGEQAEGASSAVAEEDHHASAAPIWGTSSWGSCSNSSSSSSGGECSPDPARVQHQRLRARHADADQGLPYEELIEGAHLLLAPGGRLSVILPCLQDEADRFAAYANARGLVLHKSLHVATRDEDPKPKRTCMEFIKHHPSIHQASLEPSLDSPLLVTMQTKRVAEGWVRSPTPEYTALTQDFHHPAFISQMTIPLRKKEGAC